MVATILLLLLAIILTVFVLPVVFLLATSIILNGAPFVPVPARAVPGIVDALKLSNSSVVYDMGCGDGRVLCAAAKLPGVRAIGIECALLPYVLARIRSKNLPIEIRRKDFFGEDLKSATHVVTYLFPELMGAVEQKLERELRPGTRVVAIDFPLPTWKPVEKIEQQVPGLKRGASLYVYLR